MVGRRVGRAAHGWTGRRGGGQHVGQQPGRHAHPEIEPGQIPRQHPDQGQDPQVRRQRREIAAGRAAGQVEQGDLPASRQPGRGDGGQQGRPAGLGASGHIHPVDPVRQRDRIPQWLPGEHLLLCLPVPEQPGVAVQPAGQQAFLRATGGGDAALFGCDGGPQVLAATPDGPPAPAGQPRQHGRTGRGQPWADQARQATGQHRREQRQAGAGRQPPVPAQQPFLPPLGREPAGMQPFRLGRDRAPGWRAGVWLRGCVLPAEIDPARLEHEVAVRAPAGHRSRSRRSWPPAHAGAFGQGGAPGAAAGAAAGGASAGAGGAPAGAGRASARAGGTASDDGLPIPSPGEAGAWRLAARGGPGGGPARPRGPARRPPGPGCRATGIRAGTLTARDTTPPVMPGRMRTNSPAGSAHMASLVTTGAQYVPGGAAMGSAASLGPAAIIPADPGPAAARCWPADPGRRAPDAGRSARPAGWPARRPPAGGRPAGLAWPGRPPRPPRWC